MFEIISLIANLVLSGGLIVTLVTIKSVRKKGNIEASQADMELSKSYVDEFTKNIVEPMKDKVNDLDRVASGLKREMARLRKAINKDDDEDDDDYISRMTYKRKNNTPTHPPNKFPTQCRLCPLLPCLPHPALSF